MLTVSANCGGYDNNNNNGNAQWSTAFFGGDVYYMKFTGTWLSSGVPAVLFDGQTNNVFLTDTGKKDSDKIIYTFTVPAGAYKSLNVRRVQNSSDNTGFLNEAKGVTPPANAAYNYLDFNWDPGTGDYNNSENAGRWSTYTPVSENKTYYLRGDWSNGWNDAGQLLFTKVNDTTYETPAATVTYSQKFKVYCPQISTNNGYVVVTAGTQLTDDQNGNMKLESTPDGTVKFTLTVDGSGNPTKLDASYKTTVVPPTPGGEDSKYWLVYTNSESDFTTNSKQFLTTEDSNTFSFTTNEIKQSQLIYVSYDYTDKYFDDISIKTGFGDYGANNHKYFKLNFDPQGKNVTFTLTVDGDGKPIELVAEKEPDKKEITWYPTGETESSFASSTNSYYYLAGHELNNNNPSREWEMKQYNGSTTQYYIDFTFNSHAAANEHNGIDLFSFYVWGTNKPSEGLDFIKKFDKKSELQDFLGNDNRKRGVRLRAIYDTNSKTLTLKGLHREYNPETATVTWAETDSPDMLPFMALVGREWKQPIKDKNDKTIPLTIANTDGKTFIGESYESEKNWTTTDRGWQQSWIQYDEDNFPVVSRDGKKVFFNTQWPPVSPITFTQKFKLNNEERIVNLNSDGLTFASTGESKKGSEWLSNEFSAYKYDGTDSNYGPDEKTLRLASDEMYTLYEVSNVWIAGDFKIWSGTNGWRFNNSSTGSEWDSNVQFGAYDTTTNPNLYNKATSSADANKELPAAQSKHTYGLKTYEGDMTVATPTYFQKVYLFYNTMDANDNSNNDKSRLFFLPAVGNAQIMALNSKDLDHGTFLPSIDAESLTAKSVKVEVFNRKGQSQGIILNSENLSLTSSEFNNAFSTFAPDSYNSGYFTDENHITYKQNGYYHYVMTVAFSDGSSVSVPSPEYLISNVGSNLFTAQLVEVQEGAKSDYPYNYVTYSTTTDAYGVAEDNGSYIVTKLDAAPGADFYSDANKALWTNKVLMYSQRPWTVEGYVSDGVAYEATGWTATANGTATASASGDVDYVNVVDADGFNERQYATQMSYKAGGVDQNAKAANSKARLLYPTACMAADQVNVVVSETPEVKDVTLSAENHHGHADATAFGGATYTDMEVSHLDVVAALDMPNVTVDLQNLLKNSSLDQTLALNTTIAGASLPSVKLSDATAVVTMEYLDPRNLFDGVGEDISAKQGLNVSLAPQANSTGLALYQRSGALTTTVAAEPRFNAPAWVENQNSKFDLYRTWVQNKDESGNLINSYTAYIGLRTIPQTTDNGFVVNSSVIKDEELDHAYLPLYIDDKAVNEKGHAGNADAKLFHHTDLTTNSYEWAELIKGVTTTYYNEMWADLNNPNYFKDENNTRHDKVKVAVNHTYIFEVHSAAAQPAPAYAPAKAPAAATSYVALHGPSIDRTLAVTDIITGVEGVEIGSGSDIVTGAGFIDMMGNEAMVFTTDGCHIYSGNGRVDVAAGIYLVKTAAKTFKVLVK